MKLLSQVEKLKRSRGGPGEVEKADDFPARGLNIIEVIEDPTLFGSLFRDQSTWANWKIFLKSVFSLPMSESELKVFTECTGRKESPQKQSSEAFAIVGRRGGKSFISAVIACYLAIFKDWHEYLSKGEMGWVFVIAGDKAQSRIVLNYIKEILRLDAFEDLVEKELATELRLKNGITIEVRTASYRTVRGYTVLAAILDEVGFWRDENSANPAGEILNALIPAMSTVPDSLLIGISTPYARAGVLFEVYKEFFGRDEVEIPLIWKAPTRIMNPVFRESVIKKFFERDRVAARSEYEAEFRQDLEGYLTLDLIEELIVSGRTLLPPDANIRYLAFTDPSGGSRDSFTLAIGHKENAKIIIDRAVEIRAPLDPKSVVKEFAEILKSYQVAEITGDRFSGKWCSNTFRENSIHYHDTDLSASEIYLQFQALCSMKKVELVDSERLKIQLAQLERRTRSGGNDQVIHPEGLHDDLANAVAGCAVYLFRKFKVYTEQELESRMPRVFHKTIEVQERQTHEELESEMREFVGGSGIVRR